MENQATPTRDTARVPVLVYPKERIKEAAIRADDIFLISYPKSGTHLMIHLILHVLNDGDENRVQNDKRGPPLEIAMLDESDGPRAMRLKASRDDMKGFDMENMECPRFFTSHLAYEFLPSLLHEKKPKIVYLARNPKDMIVSQWNMWQMMRKMHAHGPPPTLQSVIESFVAGDATSFGVEEYGPWYKHVTAWWAKRDDENVLFVKYEDLTKNLKDHIKSIANFLGKDVSDDVVDKIAGHCSIEAMKNNPKARSDDMSKLLGISPEDSPFVRRGKVGGWKGHLTVAQSELVDEAYRKWINCGLVLDFE